MADLKSQSAEPVTAGIAPEPTTESPRPLHRRRRRRARKRSDKPFILVRLYRDSRTWLRQNRRMLVTVFFSLFLHIAVIAVLASRMLPRDYEEEMFTVLTNSLDEPEEAEPFDMPEVFLQPDELIDRKVESSITSADVVEKAEEAPNPVEIDVNNDEIAAELERVDADAVFSTLTGKFGGRSQKGKLASVKKFGGSAESERAVASGLKWIASIQLKDGSWDFGNVGDAGGGGNLRNRTGATALALMCFLGAGHTHMAKESEYQQTVDRGLRYLMKRATIIGGEADLRGETGEEKSMYVQGLATIALCEAHALTQRNRDKTLKKVAQAGINYIVSAQHSGGGWRYKPNQAGDTSVVGWQLMALKSGKAGRLRIAPKALTGTRKFLNSVSKDGVRYGYTGPGNKLSTTAIALLCRMYQGWKRDRPELQKGVAVLNKRGPDPNNMYYNYYATQVMHHWGGEEWQRWNRRMRISLVESQVKDGPGAGSWNPRDPHSRTSGRIYETALCVMTLEVYYRHMPLYKEAVVRTAKEDNQSPPK